MDPVAVRVVAARDSTQAAAKAHFKLGLGSSLYTMYNETLYHSICFTRGIDTEDNVFY